MPARRALGQLSVSGRSQCPGPARDAPLAEAQRPL
jgi:hypothetical protein